MTTRLNIHIGAEKSGSTYLQNILWANQERLRNAGVCVPGENQRVHFDIGWDIQEKRQKDEHPPKYWVGSYRRALDEIAASGCHSAVITDERLARANRKHVAKALAEADSFDVHIVYVMRDLAGLLPSSWQEQVKNGRTFSFEEWLDRARQHVDRDTFWRYHDLDDVIRRWSPDGSVPVHVIALPPSSSDDTLWSRFCQVLEVDADVEEPGEQANPSLGWAETELLRRVQAQMPNARQARLLMKMFVSGKLLANRSSSSPILIPAAHREWIERENAARIASFERQVPAAVGSAADLEVADHRFGTPDRSHETEEQLDAAIEVIAGMAKRLAKVRAVEEGTDDSNATTRARRTISGVRDRIFPFGID